MKTFHKVLFVLAILIANCISASAIAFTVDGLRYSVNNDNTTVTVTGGEPTGDLTIPDSVTYGGISFPVTSIGNGAFRNCTGLTSVTIGKSVTSIGDHAFNGCTGLTSVTIGNSVTSIGDQTFYFCSGLTSVNIPNSVTEIGKYAFNGCTGLTSVTIGNSVTSIGGAAFSGCSGLTSLTIGNSVTSIGDQAFYFCTGLTSVTIGNSVTEIGEGAFEFCTGLTSVNIPNSVTEIGYGAFDYTAWYNNQPEGLVYAGLVAYKYKGTMPSGTSIVLKEGTKGIAGNAFSGCSGLTSITIPSTVKYIGCQAFSGSDELTEVVWNAVSCNIYYDSNSVRTHPFYNCLIMKLIIGDEVQRIPSYLMDEQIFLKSVVWNAKNCSDFSDSPFRGLTNIKTFEVGSEVERIPACLCWGLTGLTSLTIPNSVTSIGENAFDGCSGLTSIKVESGNSVYDSRENCNAIIETATNTLISGCKNTTIIPNSVTSIGYGAFEGCDGLTSVTIPNSVTSIGKFAFNGCTGLTSVTIGNSVTSIGQSAFSGCTGLTSLTIPNSVTSIGYAAFSGCYGLTSVVWNAKNCSDFSTSYQPFAKLTNIKTFEFGNEVERIPVFLCYGLTDLTSVTIPNSVTSIGKYAFLSCSGLTSVTIPNSVTSIGNYAFCRCTGLTRIDAYPNPEKVRTGVDAFYGVPKDGTLHVLPKYLSAYLTASQWRDFTHIKDDLTEITEIGDINLDGKVNVTDETTLVNMIANGETANLELADINADGKVNVSDVTALVNIILK